MTRAHRAAAPPTRYRDVYEIVFDDGGVAVYYLETNLDDSAVVRYEVDEAPDGGTVIYGSSRPHHPARSVLEGDLGVEVRSGGRRVLWPWHRIAAVWRLSRKIERRGVPIDIEGGDVYELDPFGGRIDA